MKKLLLLCLLLLEASASLYAQTDSLKSEFSDLSKPPIRRMERITSSRVYRITYIGVPLVLTGMIAKTLDRDVRNLRNSYAPTFHHRYDDYVQYAPAALMLGLKAGGVKSRSSWGRMLVSDAFSVAIMSGVVNSIKYTSKVPRPDGSNSKSFPSGHTATAFMTATMLHKEYGDRSPWYSIAGYSMATLTGVTRILNNKHWLSDVMVGAGIGILSVELGYLLADLIFKDKGLNTFERDVFCDRYRKPSFLGVDLGFNVIMGSYHSTYGTPIQFNTGVDLAVEGAWFMNPYVGFGGRLAATSTSLKNHDYDEEVSNRLDSWMACAGSYFSYPVSNNWRVGGKVVAGYQYYRPLTFENSRLGDVGGEVFGVGISTTLRVNYNFDIRLQAAYYLQPPMMAGSRQHLNTLTMGASANIAF